MPHQALSNAIEKAASEFQKDIPGIQKSLFSKLLRALGELNQKRGNIVASASNIRKINKIKRELERIILSENYLGAVKDYTKSFDEITRLQTIYFATMEKGFTAPGIMKALRKESVAAAVEQLTETGIRAEITNNVGEILKRNIAGRSKFGDFAEEIREFLLDTNTPGALSKHAGFIADESITNYARQYNAIVSEDLGFEWFVYTGGIIKTTRDFCKALVHKRHIKKSEFSSITRGVINGKTVSLAGLKPGTNAGNFIDKAGGYRCRHLVLGVSTSRVPQSLQDKIK